MNRRTFIGGIGVSLTPLAGCTSPGQTQDSNDSSQTIENRDFSLVDAEERFDPNGSEWDERFQHAADVAFETETDRIRVTGRMMSGSRSCKETVLDSASYDAANETLTVVVLDEVNDSANACTTEVAVVPYEATVTFDTGFPETVIVKHRDERGGVAYNHSFNQQ